VSILPVPAKLLEKCAYPQLIEHIVNEEILSQYQFGFRPKHSTKHAELHINNIVKSAIENKSACAIVGIDIEKAFDTVHRATLLHKLENYNISSEWFAAYINNRRQYVLHNNEKSNEISTESGLAQGGCLSGILFSIMINDLPTVITHSQPCLYADDTQIAKQISPKTTANDISLLEEDCLNVLKWMELNKLRVNVNKTT